MSQKIIKIGSSLGITLRKDLLRELKLDHGDTVKIQFNSATGMIEVSSAYAEEYAQVIIEAKKLVNQNLDELSKLDND